MEKNYDPIDYNLLKLKQLREKYKMNKGVLEAEKAKEILAEMHFTVCLIESQLRKKNEQV